MWLGGLCGQEAHVGRRPMCGQDGWEAPRWPLNMRVWDMGEGPGLEACPWWMAFVHMGFSWMLVL